MKRSNLSLLLFLFLTCSIHAQQISDALKEVFLDAEYFLVEEDYYDALLEYTKIYKRGFKDNANINYRMGICYLNLPGQKEKSISYLEKAILDLSESYTEGSLKETSAPLDALLYLGNAYRVNQKLDKACVAYNEYIEKDTKNSENVEYAKQQIEACNVAKEQITNPKLFKVENLGEPINDASANFRAILSADESKIVYVTKQKFYDALFYAEKKAGKWEEPINITPQVQSDGDQYPCYLSSDGTVLLLSKEDFFNSDIYISEYKEGSWTKSKSIGKVINTKYWESHACLSPDGKTLYYASNMKGGIGGTDIYMSKKEAGLWSEPVNLGASFNTDLNEDTPFMLEDGKTIYFSSQGHSSMGGYDIFYTQLNDDGSWSEPENLGYPLNTTDDDLFYVPLSDGSILYKTDFRKEGLGKEDIYRIEILDEEPEVTVAHVEDVDTSTTKEPVDVKHPVDVAEVEESDSIEPEIATVEAPSERVVLRPVYFGYDKYGLDNMAKQKLNVVVDVLQEYENLKLFIIGHTDSKGSFEYNKKLSGRRAQSVVNYLVAKGVDRKRLETKAQSESKPAAINSYENGSDCPEGRKLNRRVEFKLMEGQFDNIIIEEGVVPDNLKAK